MDSGTLGDLCLLRRTRVGGVSLCTSTYSTLTHTPSTPCRQDPLETEGNLRFEEGGAPRSATGGTGIEFPWTAVCVSGFRLGHLPSFRFYTPAHPYLSLPMPPSLLSLSSVDRTCNPKYKSKSRPSPSRLNSDKWTISVP